MESGSNTARMITLGHITGVFGIKGWVKVHSDTNPRENIVAYPKWYLSAGNDASSNQPSSNQPSSSQHDENVVEIESGRPQGKTIVAKLKGIDTPEQAKALTGQIISVHRSDLPTLEQDEYYWADIIGFDVQDTSGQLMGIVDRLFETGANDVLVVKGTRSAGDSASQNIEISAKETEILIPWVMGSVILKVEIAERKIYVDWDPDY